MALRIFPTKSVGLAPSLCCARTPALALSCTWGWAHSEEGLLPILIFLGGREEVVDTNLSLLHVLPRTSCWWPPKLSPRDAALPWLISWLLFWKCSHQSCADQLGQVSASSVYENLESIFLGRGVGDGLGFFVLGFFGGCVCVVIWRKGGQWWMLRILII